MPRLSNFSELVALINALSNEHDLKVSQNGLHLYELDLSHCRDYLVMLRLSVPEEQPFQVFLNTQLVQIKNDWKLCIKDSSAVLKNSLLALTSWGTMPSRVTFTTVHKIDRSERILDPDNAADQPIVLAAAQISRIVARNLELLAYSELQHRLISSKEVSTSLLDQLGELLLSLRWRLSRWCSMENESEGSGDGTEDDLQAVLERVKTLCRILNALNRPEQLPEVSLNQGNHNDGIWASTIRYREGVFCLITPYIQFYNWGPMILLFTTTESYDDGSWSQPLIIENIANEIDPELFWDFDGTVYVSVAAGINNSEVDLETGAATGPIRVWNGTGDCNPEGLRIFHKNDYYYLLIGEGGTELNQSVIITRGDSAIGPYYGYENSPIQTARFTE
ncbi:hypothetical protein S40288_10094 [Stachybotrys chartarum IBT 40288]|nr:hypothetical protein S40288_10094 [Stachybotrys chartarum IBT 40288]